MLASIYFFLMGLDMMGSSFLVLGGKGAGELFTITDNPITGPFVSSFSGVGFRFRVQGLWGLWFRVRLEVGEV